ncbi:MAG: lipoprotein NlpI [Phenylobacterium sp.]|jgi:lipoprotein NlpI
MKINKITSLLLLCGAALSGCTSTSVTLSDLIIAAPLPVHYNQEVQLARLSDILATAQISEDQRARLLFDRGVVYDNMGLKSLARFDFNQALKIKPDLAEAYNYLGVYLTLASNFDRAYEAFDSVSELKPNYEFAFFSRGIALYYGDRAKLGMVDLQRYLSFSPADPYRIIWQFIVQSKIDLKAAQADLQQNALKSPQGDWATSVIKLYLGQLSEKEFLQTIDVNITSDKQRAERLCEAYFYLGKHKSLMGDEVAADTYYRLSLATNVHGFIEHKYAKLELDLKKKIEVNG